jgi:hypothetical protein
MKRLLKKTPAALFHFASGARVEGAPPGLRGDASELLGDVTGLWGDVSGLTGHVSGLRGDVDDCEIADAERAAGVDVADLVLA